MKDANHLRVVNKNNQVVSEHAEEFTSYPVDMSPKQMLVFLLATIVVIVSLPKLLLYAFQKDILILLTLHSDEFCILISSIFSIIAGSALLVGAREAEKYKLAAQGNKYLNSLLAAALSKGLKFCILGTQNNAKIYHLNRSDEKIFPVVHESADRPLEVLLKSYGVPVGEQHHVFNAIKHDGVNYMSMQIQSDDDEISHPMIVSVESIPRLSGFYLICGKRGEVS